MVMATTVKPTCDTQGCKANMAHRLGIHSWWCKRWSPADAKAKEHLERTGVNLKEASNG